MDAREFLDRHIALFLQDSHSGPATPSPGGPKGGVRRAAQDLVKTLLRGEEASDSTERNWNWRAASLDIGGTLVRRGPSSPFRNTKGTRVLISLWDSLMFGRVPKNGAAR